MNVIFVELFLDSMNYSCGCILWGKHTRCGKAMYVNLKEV